MKKRKYTIKFSIILSIFILYMSTMGIALAPAKAQIAHIFVKEVHTPEPYTVPTVDLTGKDRAIAIIKATWGRDWHTGSMIARCEAGYREKVVNSIGATGYFQILAPVHSLPIDALKDGWFNASYAYNMWKTQGFTPWVSSKVCWEGLL